MKQWHVEHMQKTLLKFVKGLSADANVWEKRQHKKYGTFQNICRQIEYDLKHGVELTDVIAAITKLQGHKEYAILRKDDNSMARLSEIERYFTAPKPIPAGW